MRQLNRTRAYLAGALGFATHALFALAPYLWWSAYHHRPLSWLLVVSAVFVGNLPDADTTSSYIGRLLWPLARAIERRWGHRTITHSLLATAALALAAYATHSLLRLRPLTILNSQFTIDNSLWSWRWLPLFYLLHLLLDMIIGGAAGVPLLWPSRRRFWLEIDIRPGSMGERIVLFLLVVLTVVPFVVSPEGWRPDRLLRSATGNVEMALQDARAWEAFNQVHLDVEGTWQEDRRPVAGLFEVLRVVDNTFYLAGENGQPFTAGQGREDVYLRRAVAIQGPPLAAWAGPEPTPTATPTPVIVAIRIANITDPASEILVQPGDRIAQGQLLADLRAYRLRVARPSPTPLAAGYPPIVTTPLAPDDPLLPLLADQAAADLAVARAQATAAAETLPEDQLAAQAQLAIRQRELQQAQAAYDVDAWRPEVGMMPVSIALERATNAYQLAAAQATAVARPASPGEQAIAQARLRQAELAYQLALARLTPTVAPSPPPTQAPTPAPTVQTEVRSIVAGLVVAVRIASVAGEVAVVEIDVDVSSQPGPQPSPAASIAPPVPRPSSTAAPTGLSAPSAQRPRSEDGRTSTVPTSARPGKVIHVADGDTVTVRFADGTAEKARLIGVDTPETVHPDQPDGCFGAEASAYTKRRLLGATVAVATDRDERDRYGRLLVYLWLESGEFYNRTLIAEGYAIEKHYAPNTRYRAELQQAEAEARTAGRGLWTACASRP